MTRNHGSLTNFGKRLGSNEKEVRDRAVETLLQWLSSPREVSQEEMLKIWEGLFYCMWMSDKPLVQQALADQLSSALLTIHESFFLLYIRAFWTVLFKEWRGIDKHRINKFLLLARFFLRYTVQGLAQYQWKLEYLTDYTEFMQQNALKPDDFQYPVSLQYHIMDCFVTELDNAVPAGQGRNEVPLTLLLESFGSYLARVRNSTSRKRIKEEVFDALIQRLDESDVAENYPYLVKELPKLSEVLFNLGSDPSATGNGRKTLYMLSEELQSKSEDGDAAPLAKPSGAKCATADHSTPHSTVPNPHHSEPKEKGKRSQQARDTPQGNGKSRKVTSEDSPCGEAHVKTSEDEVVATEPVFNQPDDRRKVLKQKLLSRKKRRAENAWKLCDAIPDESQY
ncbi:hypothetical protein IWQ62_003643 [Dispira parvispora]|uniref:Uncharacterized protein n=1 Tax=Dispira parvispora TaxID=1520584 RepID=A0A9W8AMI1_9FUNG|nr:hypothetical protein IWQ62_003643 [Dispira parvispora]